MMTVHVNVVRVFNHFLNKCDNSFIRFQFNVMVYFGHFNGKDEGGVGYM
jgi:hypothetical protein